MFVMQALLKRMTRSYEGTDPVIRMKAKLFILLALLMLAIVPVVIFYSAYGQLHNQALGNRLNWLVLAPEALSMVFLVLAIFLLLRGRFSLGAHFLLIASFMVIWAIMFLDRSGTLSAMDTIVFVLGILSLTPLAVSRRKALILLYGGANLALLAFFSLCARGRFGLTPYAHIEYLADTAIAIVFITLTAYSVFVINQRAQELMANELAERRRQEYEKERLQAQLLHAQKMESVGRLAGGVAHDFNNLLTSVMGNTSLAITKLGADSPALPRLKDIMRAAESAAALTRQLLVFSRRQVTEPRPLDLNGHIESIAPLLEKMTGATVFPVLQLGVGVAPILADPGQVEQIVINLVVNARDAMPDGGRVVIATRRERFLEPPPGATPIMKPGDYVVLTVSDGGAGIRADDILRIFDPFFTTKPVGKGSGLGLALVYGAVQQNGGSIAVSSLPGKGTTMTVYFPVAGNIIRPRSPDLQPPELPRGGEAILLVDDDAAVLDFVRLILSSLGYRVTAVADGAAALAGIAAPGREVDLLLTDFILPDMTGTTLAAQVLVSHAGLKVLYMSGHAESMVMAEGAADSGVHFIAKPFTAQELASKIREILDAPH